MKIVIDLDGTICSLRKKGQDYSKVTPNINAIKKIQELKTKGHYIIIQTARHMETCGSNIGLINAKIGKKTIDWLENNNIPYDEIFFGKPNADVYIDDKAKMFNGWENIRDITNQNDNIINIVIPMAGAGSRFQKEGYSLPKPLIEVKGRTMVDWAIDSFNFLKKDYKLQFIFIVLKEHIEKYQIDQVLINRMLKDNNKNYKIIPLKEITRGQAETVLLAKKYINDFNKLIIYNADTFSNYNLNEFPIDNTNIEGIITCFESTEEKYSYAKLDRYGYVTKVAEKKAISTNATNGLYYFKNGYDFVNYTEIMIKENNTQNNEFYVGPLYNYLINSGKRIVIAPVKENWILGTPQELDYFLKTYQEPNA